MTFGKCSRNTTATARAILSSRSSSTHCAASSSTLASGFLKRYDTNRSGRLDLLEFNKLVKDMRLVNDDPAGSLRAIRQPTADQPHSIPLQISPCSPAR